VLHERKEKNAEIHLETMEEKLTSKLDRDTRNIKNSVDLSRIKLLEKIARLEIFFKEGITSACSSLKNTLEENIISNLFNNLKKITNF
jgi:hypothetical protein